MGALASGELLPAAQRGGAAQLPIAPLANTTTPRAHLLPGYPLTSHNQRPGTSPGPYLPLHAAFIYPG